MTILNASFNFFKLFLVTKIARILHFMEQKITTKFKYTIHAVCRMDDNKKNLNNIFFITDHTYSMRCKHKLN